MAARGEGRGIWLLAWVGCCVACLPVIIFSVVVPATVTIPFGMGLGGVFAGTIASITSNRQSSESRARLLPVVAVTEGAALALAGVFVGALIARVPLPPVILVIALGGVAALGASKAAKSLRTTRGRRLPDLVVSLILVVVGIGVTLGGIPALCATTVSCHA